MATAVSEEEEKKTVEEEREEEGTEKDTKSKSSSTKVYSLVNAEQPVFPPECTVKWATDPNKSAESTESSASITRRSKHETVHFADGRFALTFGAFSKAVSGIVLDRVKHLDLPTDEDRPMMRVQIEDDLLTDNLWRAVSKFIPDDLTLIQHSPYFSKRGGSEWNKCGLMPVMDVVKQQTGGMHTPLMNDRFFKRFLIRDNERYQQQSFLVCTLFLSTKGDDFEGGTIAYFFEEEEEEEDDEDVHDDSDDDHSDDDKKSEDDEELIEMEPPKRVKKKECFKLMTEDEQGSVLTAVYDLPYSVAPLTSGVRYLVRMHVLYERLIVVDAAMKERMASMGLWKTQQGDWQVLPPL